MADRLDTASAPSYVITRRTSQVVENHTDAQSIVSLSSAETLR